MEGKNVVAYGRLPSPAPLVRMYHSELKLSIDLTVMNRVYDANQFSTKKMGFPFTVDSQTC